MTLYKLTDPAGRPVHGGSGTWDLPNGKPGKWRSVRGDLVPCRRGLHLLRAEDVPRWLRAGVLWTVEAGPERIVQDDKVVVRRARLTGKAAEISDRVLRELAADFAEHVLPIFEKKRPGDMRPREAIAAARAFARGSIGRDELLEKRYAAYAAYAYADAYAASAAYAAAAAYADAADASAAYAAYAAAADAYAAYAGDAADAARSKERAWQASRVVEVLGLR